MKTILSISHEKAVIIIALLFALFTLLRLASRYFQERRSRGLTFLSLFKNNYQEEDIHGKDVLITTTIINSITQNQADQFKDNLTDMIPQITHIKVSTRRKQISAIFPKGGGSEDIEENVRKAANDLGIEIEDIIVNPMRSHEGR